VAKLVLGLEEMVVVVESSTDGFELEKVEGKLEDETFKIDNIVEDVVELEIVVGITVDDVDELEGMLLVEVDSVLVEWLSVLPIVLKM
jgi:hypothetical protein